MVVAGVETGLVPHASAATAAARAEEVRLLHVALTRAEDASTSPGQPRRGGSTRALTAARALGTRADPVVPPPPRLRRGRAPAVDPALAALRAWRRSAAIAVGLPEPTICTDEALAAVARRGRRTVDELAALPEIGPIAARRLGPRLLAALDRAQSARSTTTGA